MHKFSKTTSIYIVLQYFTSYPNYCIRDHFMRYRIRVNGYKLLGMGVVGSYFGVHLLSVFFGVSHVGKSSGVALVFGFGMDNF